MEDLKGKTLREEKILNEKMKDIDIEVEWPDLVIFLVGFV